MLPWQSLSYPGYPLLQNSLLGQGSSPYRWLRTLPFYLGMITNTYSAKPNIGLSLQVSRERTVASNGSQAIIAEEVGTTLQLSHQDFPLARVRGGPHLSIESPSSHKEQGLQTLLLGIRKRQ
jgi:hypothetical protein